MALFAVGWSPILLKYAGWIFDHLLIVLNKVVFWVDSLPFALSKGMVVSLSEMTLLYIVIVMACWFIADRRAKVLLVTLVCVLMLCTAFSIGSIKKDNTKKLVVYSVSGKKAIAFIMQRQVYYDFDSALINNPSLMRYNIRDHWWQCGVERETSMDSMKVGNEHPYDKIYTVNGKSILVLDRELPYSSSTKLKADVVILSGNTKNSIDEIKQRIDFKELVFDTSNKPHQLKQWKQDCEKLKIKYHDCHERAFEMDL